MTDDEKLELLRLQLNYEAKCDELKESMILNGKLRTLLHENNIDHDY